MCQTCSLPLLEVYTTPSFLNIGHAQLCMKGVLFVDLFIEASKSKRLIVFQSNALPSPSPSPPLLKYETAQSILLLSIRNNVEYLTKTLFFWQGKFQNLRHDEPGHRFSFHNRKIWKALFC